MTDTPRPQIVGAIGLPITGGYLRLERSSNLVGAKAAQTFREMRTSEPACAAMAQAALSLLRTDLTVTPGGPSDGDKEAADWLQISLGQMRTSLPAIIRQMYGSIWYGWSLHEMSTRRDAAGRIALDDLGLRRQETLLRWLYDDNDGGRVTGFVQQPPPNYRLRTLLENEYVHVVSDETEGSPEGLSIYRPVYRLWRIVANLEMLWGIGLERFGTGVPVFELDETVVVTDELETLIQTYLTQLRQNESAGISTPPGVRFRFAESPGLSAGDYLESIRYLRLVMLSTMLADFLGLGTQSGGGAYALGQDKSELFLLSLNTVQDRVTEALNRQAVRALFRYRANQFPGMTGPPTVALPAVKRYDLDKIGGLVQVLNSAGALTLTPADEVWFRKISDLLDKDEATILRDRAEIEDHARAEAMDPMAPEPPGPEPADVEVDDPGADANA